MPSAYSIVPSESVVCPLSSDLRPLISDLRLLALCLQPKAQRSSNLQHLIAVVRLPTSDTRHLKPETLLLNPKLFSVFRHLDSDPMLYALCILDPGSCILHLESCILNHEFHHSNIPFCLSRFSRLGPLSLSAMRTAPSEPT